MWKAVCLGVLVELRWGFELDKRVLTLMYI